MSITSLWHWLRDRYPQGALRSQFLGIHGDRFLVQVGLYGREEDVTPFLTALGSGHSLEAAEDQGHQRLWAWVQASPAPSALGVSSALAPPETSRSAITSPPEALTPPHPSPVSTTLTTTAGGSNGRGGTAIALVDRPETRAGNPQITEAVDQRVDPESVEPTRFEFDSEPELLAPAGVAPSPAAPAPTPPPSSDLAPPAPVDLSDIIAQTGIELRRLGWTDAQGREYLKSTYGKLSRHHLSDAELLEFLCYLESLPTPHR